ncbi:hypothetical protein FN976_28635, partial [Caenimonas sedimenti]
MDAAAHPSVVLDLEARASQCRGGRNNIPAPYRDMATWPGFDETVLPAKDKARYRRLRDASSLYLKDKPLSEVTAVAQISERRFLRIFARAFERDASGAIIGCRAFAKGAYITPPQRTHLNPPSADGKGGFSGAFRLLFKEHPEIENKLITYLNGFGLRGLRPNRLMFRGIHRKFGKLCVEEGIGPKEYPLNTSEKGRRALRLWIDSTYLPKYASRFVHLEHGKDAADLLQYGEGTGTADREYGGYGAWIIDATTVDLEARYELPSPMGDWESLDLRRFQQLRCIHKGTSANLANRQVYTPQVSGHDISILFWDAVNGPEPVAEVIPGAKAEPDAGYPACVIPELRFAIPSVVYLDNALAHLADVVQHLVANLFGAKVILGSPKTPHERAQVESKFSLQARRVVHQLPGTTGSNPRDPRRKTHAVKVDQKVRAEEIEQVLDINARNENALPAAGAHNVAPLERLRRLLSAGALKPNYLPADKRKAHYFSKPHPVTVKVDTPTGRRPYVNYLYQRYSSNSLAKRFDLKGQRMWVRPDFRNIRTVMLFDDTGREFGPIQALGHWGTFPHDARIRRIFGKLKREGELGPRADDQPLEALFEHLRNKAPRDPNAALQLTHLIQYLRRHEFAMGPEMTQGFADWEAASKAAQSIEILPLTTLRPSNAAPVHPAAASST